MMCLSFPDSTDPGCSSNSDMPVELAVSVMLLCGVHCHHGTVTAEGVDKQSGCLMKRRFLDSK